MTETLLNFQMKVAKMWFGNNERTIRNRNAAEKNKWRKLRALIFMDHQCV